MRTITCINKENNISCSFTESEFSPFILRSIDGIYEQSSKIMTSSNAFSDGSVYQSSVLETRNIVLYLKDLNDHTKNRQFLIRMFPPDTKGTLIINDDNLSRKIDYYVEKITSDSNYSVRNYQISLMCPDPYFYDIDDYTVTMASYLPSFVFSHEFNSLKEEFGYRQKNKLQNIKNEQGADKIGITIVISAEGSVKNPSIIRVESSEFIKVGTDTKPFIMSAGDKVIITTGNDNKHIYLESGGVQTNISQYMSDDSTFIQLEKGDNSIAYSADSGVDSIEVSIKYRIRYTSA